jgi:TolB-like protein
MNSTFQSGGLVISRAGRLGDRVPEVLNEACAGRFKAVLSCPYLLLDFHFDRGSNAVPLPWAPVNMLFSFENCSLDTDGRELRSYRKPVPMQPQVFDLLEYLIRHRGRVVSKDELISAIWDGRIVSDSALATRINAVRVAIGDSGEAQRLIRTFPRKGVRFVGEVLEGTPSISESGPSSVEQGSAGSATIVRQSADQFLPMPDKPSIAVLPFQNMSSDPEQGYFADGMVEDIITALSRFKSLFVIARNSSFTYKGKDVDIKQVGRLLGVRYVLEGSVRKSGGRVRVAGQLIEAATGTHLWADRFDGTLSDVFDLQDAIAEQVVGALVPTVQWAEVERRKVAPTDDMNAYDWYYRGRSELGLLTKESTETALRFAKNAIDIDPNFVYPYTLAIRAHFYLQLYRWIADQSQILADGTIYARRAIELGRNDAEALSEAAFFIGNVAHDLEAAAILVEQALRLNPNSSRAWDVSASISLYRGEHPRALEHFERARRLNPLDPAVFWIDAGHGAALVFSGRYEEALALLQKALSQQPRFAIPLRLSIIALVGLGRMEQARRAVEELRRLDPSISLSALMQVLPFQKSADLAFYSDAMRKAGLPE